MNKKFLLSRSTFFCFTPLVSLSTFAIEIFLALFVVIKYKMTGFNRLAVIIIILLGTFQLSEYLLCTTENQLFWAKIGTASIALLPAMGLHLITLLSSKSRQVTIGYIFAAAIVGLIFFNPALTIHIQCTGNFVILLPQNIYLQIYMYYYVGFLLIGIWKIIAALMTPNKYNRELFWMLVAYLSFIVPTIFVYAYFANTREAVPSIMCGFAIFMALILVLKIIPGFNNRINKSSKTKK